jgi:hypothetical protein
MALHYDYFSAPNDDLAAATIVWTGGPANPPDANGGLVGHSSQPAAYRTVHAPGIEPVVMMGTLESLLSGRSPYESIEDSPGGSVQTIAVSDGGERVIFRLSTDLQRLLAAADSTQLTTTAGIWSETREFVGQGDPAVLSPLLQQLSHLARIAQSNDEHLYCWMSV